jgi:hypothetical protein
MKTSTKSKGLTAQIKKECKNMRQLRKRGRSGKSEYWIANK